LIEDYFSFRPAASVCLTARVYTLVAAARSRVGTHPATALDSHQREYNWVQDAIISRRSAPVQFSLHPTDFNRAEPPYRYYFAPLTIFLLIMGFIAAPFPLEQKAHALMHGICAQRPSHSFLVGDSTLPFDARMTGIYLGFVVAFGLLIATGRYRHAGFLSPGSLLIVLLLVGTMAIDGFNSLFTDLRMPTLYQPDNRLRLFTGMGAGVGLAVMLVMLLGMSLWRRPDLKRRAADRWWQPLGLYAAGVPLALALLTGNSMLFVPATLLLVLSATIAFSALALVSVVMVKGRENTFNTVLDLQLQIVWGAIGGVIAIASLAILRFGFEAITNAPPLT